MCEVSVLGIIFLFIGIIVLGCALSELVDNYTYSTGWYLLVIGILCGIISTFGFIYVI